MNNKGQSIIEVLIVALIISIALTAGFSLFSQFYFSNQLRGEQVVANYLAAEGIELVKNYIDANRMIDPSSAFNKDLDGCDGNMNKNGCVIDVRTNHSDNLPKSSLSLPDLSLYIDYLNHNFYVNNYSGVSGPASPFARTISVSQIPSGDGQNKTYEIVSRVNWQTRSGPIEVRLKNYFYDYQ